MRIACDIDDVLCNFVKEFIDFYNINFNKNISFEDFYSYSWYDVLNYSKKEFFPILENFLISGAYLRVKPISEMIKFIKDLSKDYEIYLITARPEKFHKDTVKWLDIHMKNSYKELIYSNNEHNYINQNLSKGEICQKLGIKLIFEDAPNYALSCSEKGIKTFLIDKPWNKELIENDNIIRVKNINEIKKEFFQIMSI